MITFFTIPKPHVGKTRILQENALNSWLAVDPSSEIIVFGDEKGIEELASKERVQWFPEVQRTKYGTPILSDVFARALQVASHEMIAYVNADIIFFRQLLRVLSILPPRPYMLVGTRFNNDIERCIDFDDESAKLEFISKLCFADHNRLSGSDYFIWNIANRFNALPDFSVGRPCWDNWMYMNALREDWMLIDCSQAICCIHQNHDYNHVPGKEVGSQPWRGPEGYRNQYLYLKDFFDNSASAQRLYPKLYAELNDSCPWPSGRAVRKYFKRYPLPILSRIHSTHTMSSDLAIAPAEWPKSRQVHLTLKAAEGFLHEPGKRFRNHAMNRMRKMFFPLTKAQSRLENLRLQGIENAFNRDNILI